MSTNAGEDDQGSSTTAVRIPACGFRDSDCRVWDDRTYCDVKRILVYYHGLIVSYVWIEYIDENGGSIWGARHSYDQPSHLFIMEPSRVVELDHPSEYLISIHGFYTKENLTSLSFVSNRKTWGPYGEERGTKFAFPILGAKIVGFHGFTRRSLLKGIGVYVQPITRRKRSLKPQVPKKPQPKHFSLGLYGREDGESWSETFRAIKQLVVYYDDNWIISIQIEYVDDNGKSVWSKKHGGDEGTQRKVTLEYPHQYLVTLSGSYDYSLDSKSATERIRTLTVITNSTAHYIGNDQGGTMFGFPREERLKVVGIHGRSDNSYLNAIGLYAALI